MATASDQVCELLDAVRVEQAALRKAETIHAREHAPGFNMVEMFALGETTLSAILRRMLDERGSHGQGDLFRNLFFETVPEARIAGADWRKAIATCEAPTRDGRRIDLLLETAGRSTALVIENKPWAGWQDRQLESYRSDQLVGRAPGQVKVLALVGGVADPQAYVEAHWRSHEGASPFPEGEVAGVGFGTVAAWIDRCGSAARPAKVTTFLRDLAAHMEEQVEGTTAMDDNVVTAAIMEGGVKRLRAALAVGAALPAVLRRLCGRVVGQLRLLDGFGERWSATSTVDGSKAFGVTLASTGGPTLSYALLDLTGGFRPWVGLVATPEEGEAFNPSALKLGRDGRWLRWEYLTEADPVLFDACCYVDDGSLARAVLVHADRLAAALIR